MYAPPHGQDSDKQVSSTFPCSSQLAEEDDNRKVESHYRCKSGDKWHPPVDLRPLNKQEQEVVRKMLFKESDVFA